MNYIELEEVLETHNQIIKSSGGSLGLRDPGALESALAQPRATFGGQDLYETPAEKAAALGFSIILNHAFVDGNKRIGHACIERFLLLNGYEIQADVDEQEQIILRVAAGEMAREDFTDWLAEHIIQAAKPV